MSTKLYVGNLAYTATEDSIRDLFSQHGTVDSCQIIIDRDTGRSKGFGFVEMSSKEEAEGAINSLNGKPHEGRNLTVNEARPQAKREGFGSSGGRPGFSGGGRGGQRRGGRY